MFQTKNIRNICFLFFFIILDKKSFIKIKHNLLLPIFIYGITVHSTVYDAK